MLTPTLTQFHACRAAMRHRGSSLRPRSSHQLQPVPTVPPAEPPTDPVTAVSSTSMCSTVSESGSFAKFTSVLAAGMYCVCTPETNTIPPHIAQHVGPGFKHLGSPSMSVDSKRCFPEGRESCSISGILYTMNKQIHHSNVGAGAAPAPRGLCSPWDPGKPPLAPRGTGDSLHSRHHVCCSILQPACPNKHPHSWTLLPCQRMQAHTQA